MPDDEKQRVRAHAFEEPDTSRFVSPGEVMQGIAVKFGTPGSAFWKLNDAAARILANSDGPAIAEHLEAQGFHRLSPRVQHGAAALIMEGEGHRMIRLVHSEKEPPRSDNPIVVQPLSTEEIHAGYRMEVLPKVHTAQEVVADAAAGGNLAARYGIEGNVRGTLLDLQDRMTADLARCGLALNDGGLENFAVMQGKDSKPVLLVLDANMTGRTGKEPSRQSNAILKYYREAQQAHLERLGLKASGMAQAAGRIL